MDASDLVLLSAETLYLVLIVSMPALLASLAVGLGLGVLQAVTQVQEQTLTFVPKLVAVAAVLALLGGWMTGELVRFTTELWTAIPRLVG
jgi:flagellar biosynthetic protein FliQ